MKTLVDEELMDAQFDHWEMLDGNSVIKFRLKEDESEYYPAQYLTAKKQVKHLELRVDSPATLYVFAKGSADCAVEIYYLEDEQYKLLDTVPEGEFGQVHKTEIKAQRNTVFLFFKMVHTGAAKGRMIEAMTSLSRSAIERKSAG